MTIKPLADRVVIKLVDVEEKTKSGIIITNNVKEYIVTSLSAGIFFLPKEKYSAKLFLFLYLL